MLERTRRRTRSRSISISLELWEQISKVCKNKTSVSGFIRMAVKKELRRRGIG